MPSSPAMRSFTVDGEEVDAPAGTLVYLDDVTQQRSAVAKVANTTVLAIGGKPGLHEISDWEYFFPSLPHIRSGDYDTARTMLQEALQEHDAPVLHYQLGCVEALAGNADAAFAELEIAVAAAERFRGFAAKDDDLVSIRDDPRFAAPNGRRVAARRLRARGAPARVAFGTCDEQHGAERVLAEQCLHEQLQPEAERERLVRLLAAEGHELLGLGDPREHIAVRHAPHRDVGDDRVAARAGDADRERRRADQRRAAVRMRQDGPARSP